MALSAADLQRRHELEGAPDPFPSFADKPAKSNSPSGSKGSVVDTNSDAAFPTLGGAATTKKPVTAAWGAGSAPRVASPAVEKATAVQTCTLSSVDLSQVPKQAGKQPTLLEYQKSVGSKFRVQVTSTQQRSTGHTTFTVKSNNDKDVIKARKHLIATLSPMITLKVEAPNSVLPAIIGPGGATIKAIRDKTNAKIDVPRRNDAVDDTTRADDDPEDDDEPTTTVSISAPEPLAHEAKAMVEEIINTKKPKFTQRIRDIPSHVLPFIVSRESEFITAGSGAGEATLAIDKPNNTVVITGDREAVKAVAEKLNSTVVDLKTGLTPLKMPLPKQQHRLLTDTIIADILQKTQCSVTLPDTGSEEIMVWGNMKQGANLTAALSTVLERVNSQHTQEFALPVDSKLMIMTYFMRTGYGKKLKIEHPKVSVYFPLKQEISTGGMSSVDFVGEKMHVEAASASLSSVVASIQGANKTLSIDHLRHKLVQRKVGPKRMKQFLDHEHVFIFFPDDSEESSSIFLVFDPAVKATDEEKASKLEAIKTELESIANDSGEFKSRSITVEEKWHDAIRGKDGTTLNAIIGDEKILSIKLDGITNKVVIRGLIMEVDRAVDDVNRIVEAAKNDEIDNNYVTEFEIDREYVGRVVGQGGSAINRLRDLLGVKLDVIDEAEDKSAEVAKKKRSSSTAAKAKLKISGRKENAEEAKRRILNQVDRLADETSEVIKIPAQFHSSLIGASGKYVIRLEEKYAVKITFPRDGGDGETRTREQLKSDEVLIKGGKKGVAASKAELLEALEFEQESNHTTDFMVDTKLVPRILGRSGSTINAIKDDTDAQIDVDKVTSEKTKISLRGSKKGIAAAKMAIMSIVDQAGDETTEILKIESKYHRTLIGAGGSELRETIVRCGGPADSRAQAGLVHFPRPNEKEDEIQIRGNRTLVRKLKAEFESKVATLRDQVVMGLNVPAVHHKNLIGRGGQHLNELQDRTKTKIQFPGSRAYDSVGVPENSQELKDVEAVDLVKILGPRAACQAAVEEFKTKMKTMESKSKAAPPPSINITVSVPRKFHHTIHQQGAFPRQLRSMGVQLEQTGTLARAAFPKPKNENGTNTARIDDEGPEQSPSVGWQLVQNYQDAEEGSDDWVLKARDQESLDAGKKHLEEAISHAEESSHVGFLTLPNRTAFPRIVGSKGANVARLRAETGADITVSKDDNLITIIGNEKAIEDAKSAILKIAGPRNRDD